jgi:hypothetical protein
MPSRLLEFDDGDENDPRQDPATRKRIREIVAGLVAWQGAVDRRYWIVTALTIFCVICGILTMAVGYGLLQGQRFDALRDGCERTNQQALATVGLLRDLHVSDRVVMLAMVRYPHTPPLAHREGAIIVAGQGDAYDGPMSCSEFAGEHVGWFRL